MLSISCDIFSVASSPPQGEFNPSLWQRCTRISHRSRNTQAKESLESKLSYQIWWRGLRALHYSRRCTGLGCSRTCSWLHKYPHSASSPSPGPSTEVRHPVDTGISTCLVRVGAGMHHKRCVFSSLSLILPTFGFMFLVTPGHKRLERNNVRTV